MTTAVSIHEQDLPGDILIFLTGQEECESAVSMLEEEARRFRRAQGSSLRLMPVALYAGLPAASQLQVFEATPRSYRKVCCYGACCDGLAYPVLSCAVRCWAVLCCGVLFVLLAKYCEPYALHITRLTVYSDTPSFHAWHVHYTQIFPQHASEMQCNAC